MPTLVDELLRPCIPLQDALGIVPQQYGEPLRLDVLLQLVLPQVVLALPYELLQLSELVQLYGLRQFSPLLLYALLQHVLLLLLNEPLLLYALLQHVSLLLLNELPLPCEQPQFVLVRLYVLPQHGEPLLPF